MTEQQAPSWAFDEADLAALHESICRVLDGEADRRTLHRYLDRESGLDRTLWSKAVELGWLAIGLPQTYGGLGFGPRGLDILYRELGRRAAPGPFVATLAATQTLFEVADAATRDAWLPRLAAGECSIAVPALIGDGQTRSNWLLGAEDAEVALMPVSGGDWGLVPIESAAPVDIWDRTRSIFTATLDARPLVRLPGEATARLLARHLALALASDSVGGARGIAEQTIGYMKQREQFDRVIASFQALKHRVADLITMTVAAEEAVALAVENAADASIDADIWANLAKAHATDSFAHIAADCVQLHGGVGVTWEYDVHIFLKRARLSEMLIAPNGVMRDRAAAGLADAVRADRQPLELELAL